MTSPWQNLEPVARSQAGAFSFDQARIAGFPSSTIGDQVRRGVWRQLGPRVYVSSGSPVTAKTREYAALLRLGAEAALSHVSSAAVFSVARQPSIPWVTIPRGHRAPPKSDGIRVLRATNVEVLRLGDGRRVVPLPRTLLDLSQCWSERDVAAAYLQALQREQCTVEDVEAAYLRAGSRYPGRAMCRRVIAEFKPEMESILGAALFKLFAPHVPGLVAGYEVADGDGVTRICDAGIPDLGMDLEADSWAFHGSKVQQQRDRYRDRKLYLAGILTARFLTDDILRTPEATLRDGLAMIEVRRRELAA